MLWQRSLVARWTVLCFVHGCMRCKVASCVHPLDSFRSPLLIFTSHGSLRLSVSCQNVKVLCSEGKQGSLGRWGRRHQTGSDIVRCRVDKREKMIWGRRIHHRGHLEVLVLSDAHSRSSCVTSYLNCLLIEFQAASGHLGVFCPPNLGKTTEMKRQVPTHFSAHPTS